MAMSSLLKDIFAALQFLKIKNSAYLQ